MVRSELAPANAVSRVDYQMTGIMRDFLINLSCVTSSTPSTSAVAPINRS
jgi:hypothetical protein